MKFGIPNLIPFLVFVMFVGACIFLIEFFWTHPDRLEGGGVIFLLVALPVCLAMVVLCLWLSRIIIVAGSSVIVYLPLKFRYVAFQIDDIIKMDWELWSMHRLGDYRRLLIKTRSGFQVHISDFELLNYDSLEGHLVSNSNLPLDLERRRAIALEQAKSQRWFVFAGMASSLFFILYTSGGPSGPELEAMQMILAAICIRWTVRLVQYQKRVNQID